MIDGECTVRVLTNPNGVDELLIERADPRVRISAELLAMFRADSSGHPGVCLDGDVLTIRARNRTVVYVIGLADYDQLTDTYPMEWPD